jgi:hypothetical protein
MLLDATRLTDGGVVCIKRIASKRKTADEQLSDEVEIARFLSSPALSQCNNNHCVTIIDFFCDAWEPTVQYLVMPLLRLFDDPEFGAVGEVVDFVTQILEVCI